MDTIWYLKIPGLHSLRDMDDETQLIQLVQQYCRLRRNNAELFFDGALPGMPGVKTGGLVHVHSVPKGLTADQAIVNFLNSKGKSAKTSPWSALTGGCRQKPAAWVRPSSPQINFPRSW